MTYVKTPAAVYFEWGQIADFSMPIPEPCRRIRKSVEDGSLREEGGVYKGNKANKSTNNHNSLTPIELNARGHHSTTYI